MKFRIFAGLGGGFGGADEHGVYEFDSDDEAMEFAYEKACEEYDSYDGMHGLRSVKDIMEEDDLDEASAESQWRDERESWLSYHVEPVDEKKESNLEILEKKLLKIREQLKEVNDEIIKKEKELHDLEQTYSDLEDDEVDLDNEIYELENEDDEDDNEELPTWTTDEVWGT